MCVRITHAAGKRRDLERFGDGALSGRCTTCGSSDVSDRSDGAERFVSRRRSRMRRNGRHGISMRRPSRKQTKYDRTGTGRGGRVIDESREPVPGDEGRSVLRIFLRRTEKFRFITIIVCTRGNIVDV